eukprot:scaffold16864_cov27-Tisochrysis_lutea.AAC.2
MRDGSYRIISASDLVPGDLIRVSAGVRVPADARLVALSSTTLRVDQAILTGESAPVMKEAEAVAEVGAEIQARRNMLFSGTTVAYGSATAIVVSTATKTEIGKIGKQVSTTETAASPLKMKLDEFGELLTKVCCNLFTLS